MGPPYVVGVDGGTEGIRAGVFDLEGNALAFASTSYSTNFPKPGWAEQDPEDWWNGLGDAVRSAVQEAGVSTADILSIGVDSTCCSVVALDTRGCPLRPSLLWMDMRSAGCAEQVASTGDDALRVNSGGKGPVSAEWMIPKALWLKKNEPDLFAQAKYICEYQDFINFRLTGSMVASVNNASIRWHYSTTHGWPVSLLEKLDLSDLKPKWPQEVVNLGEVVGKLSADAAARLGLREGIPVAQGGADAFVGMVGLGVVESGQLAMLTGSSHLHLGLTNERDLHGTGMWGAYPDAVVSGLGVVEGGQTSTGSAVAWFRRLISGGRGEEDLVPYSALNEEAEAVPIGCEGLVCLDHFQGNRTPFTDPLSRGALAGLTLKHGRGHIFRGLIESVCLGTELVFEAMQKAGYTPSSVAVAGGATRSPLWLQTHADVSNVPMKVTKEREACLLGSAILAAVAGGLFPDIPSAAQAMVHVVGTVMPNPEAHLHYKQLLERYRTVYPALKPLFRDKEATAPPPATEGFTEPGVAAPRKDGERVAGFVNASILAADMADLSGEVGRAVDGGADWIHVDVVDNHFAKVLTFGPPVVASLRRRHPLVFFDVHLAVNNPHEYVDPLKKAGASQVLFHPEALTGGDDDTASKLAERITEAGMRAGVALRPETPVSVVLPLLRPRRLVHCVDVLAVQPGFGGQRFDSGVLAKVEELRSICPELDIQVDGGVSAATAQACVAAGANVLTSGSFIFGDRVSNTDKDNAAAAIAELRGSLNARWPSPAA
eukprot:g6443.t1